MLQNAYWMPTFSVLLRSTTIGSKYICSMSIVPRRRMQPLSKGKDEQARAEQREAGRGQCQEATGNNVSHAVSYYRPVISL
ncbi:hypothetical protein ABID58_007563 [Bradyrhizobium sp. S3.2.6]|uniref:hypothetical protein n=1 Tax=Bradyrhizobium sp. S3.2.6 TaxID=3156428 RepID=UPI003395A81E